MREAPPPRLTVLAASDADVAVVLRRGPTDWARLSLWDTGSDTLVHGGWVHARVDGRRCDLSPDGRLFVAFLAAHGRTHRPDAPDGWRSDTWVAISRPPWWTALALWWNGTTWDHGGFFPDARSCSVGPGEPDAGQLPAWFDAAARLPAPRPGPDWTTATVPHNRRLRDGWLEVDPGWWERPLADGAVAVAREAAHGTGHTGTETAIRRGEAIEPLGAGASLAVDRRGRALVGRGGRLEVHDGSDLVRVVEDLSRQRPDPRPAPAAAGRWPSPPP